MLVALGWLLLAATPHFHSNTPDSLPAPIDRPAGGRIAIWSDRDDPYRRGDAARVFLRVEEPSYVTVVRVDTDGRLRVLFPRDPWDDSYVRDGEELEVTGAREGRSFLIDDDPGVGYLFAVAAPEPFDYRDVTRGDYWDYRLVGGRLEGDPYVGLTDLAARIAPQGDYDYDVTPYYVDQRYDYPRFVCYDCHAYASYREWDPYRASCARYRIEVRDDPRYYPYRYGGGRNVVTERPAHPGPRYVFRDVYPRHPQVSADESARLQDADGRTSEDVGGRGSVPAPRLPSLQRRDREPTPELSPSRPLRDERRRAERRRDAREHDDSARETPDGLRPTDQAPRSTGEPELRRRRQ